MYPMAACELVPVSAREPGAGHRLMGVMIESRWSHAARLGVRALGRHPVMPSTFRSNSNQRPLFA